LRETLLDWYRAHRRDLPWRHTQDPYAILVSEMMLQQTRVETVIPYYEDFMRRYPDAAALALADTDEVLSQWAGLGYYRRARNLQAAARHVVTRYAGTFPQDVQSLRELPGVGAYTAGAVASIAFDRPEPVLDGNVMRLLSRVFGIREEISERATQAHLWELAKELAQGPSPGDLNQALMEFGSLCCTPRSPKCAPCPLRRHCSAFRDGDAEALPLKRPKRASPVVRAVGVLAKRGDKALFVQRASDQLLGGFWELPGTLLGHTQTPESAASDALRTFLALDLDDVRSLGEIRHVFSHRQLQMVIVEGTVSGRIARRGPFLMHRWFSPRDFAKKAPTALTRKALALVLEQRATINMGPRE